MLGKLQELSVKADARYASDAELEFIQSYVDSFNLRLAAYQKIQALERDMVETVYQRLLQKNPQFFQMGRQDYTPKWRQDTTRVLRFAAMAMLYDDAELYKRQFLYWFQTLMLAFGTQEHCNQTYGVMQEVVREMLPREYANLFYPFLEVTRTVLGTAK
jgi:hypothetical protein